MKNAHHKTDKAFRIRYVTSHWLRSKGVCGRAVAAFESSWGKRAEITPDNLLIANELAFDLEAFARHALTATGWAAFERSRRAMRGARTRAFRRAEAIYEEADKAVALAERELDEANEQAQAAFESALACAETEYEKERAYEIRNRDMEEASRDYAYVVNMANDAYEEADESIDYDRINAIDAKALVSLLLRDRRRQKAMANAIGGHNA